MSLDDDQLLAALGRAIGPDPTEAPSAAERDALRKVVLQAGATADPSGTAGERLAPVVAITAARRWRHRVAAGAVASAVVLSGATAVAAAANNGALPTPVRTVVRAVGLPVDSPALADAKDALRRLRSAEDNDLAEAIDRVEKALTKLSDSERAGIADEAAAALAAARDRLATATAATAPSTSAPTTATTAPRSSTSTDTSTSTQPSTGTSTATSIDDKGGDNGSGKGGNDDSSATTDDNGSGKGGNDGTSATTDDNGSGKGGNDGTSGSDDSSATSASSGSTTATTEDGGSGKGKGGSDTTVRSTTSSTAKAQDSAKSVTTATTADSGSGKGSDG